MFRTTLSDLSASAYGTFVGVLLVSLAVTGCSSALQYLGAADEDATAKPQERSVAQVAGRRIDPNFVADAKIETRQLALKWDTSVSRSTGSVSQVSRRNAKPRRKNPKLRPSKIAQNTYRAGPAYQPSQGAPAPQRPLYETPGATYGTIYQHRAQRQRRQAMPSSASGSHSGLAQPQTFGARIPAEAERVAPVYRHQPPVPGPAYQPRASQRQVIPTPPGARDPVKYRAPSYRQPLQRAAGGGTIRIVRGDTLYSLARRYGVTVRALMAANGLNGTLIYAGQTLRIPSGG